MSGDPPSRRRLLCRLGAGLTVSTAGCLGSDGSDGSDGSNGTDTVPPASPTRTGTPSPSPSPTPSATPPDVETPADEECEPVRPSPTTPGADGLEPEPYPDLPDEPTREAVESFARSFERAFTTNAVVAGTSTHNVPGGLDRLDLYDGSTESRTAGSGILVEVSFSITYEDDVSDETPMASGKTPSPAPTGHTSVSASYYVTERFAFRRGGGLWVVVACA